MKVWTDRQTNGRLTKFLYKYSETLGMHINLNSIEKIYPNIVVCITLELIH